MNMSFKSLDVGCGPKDNPNYNYLYGDNIIHIDIDKTIRPDCYMDACHLGFKPKCFEIVHARHIIEHVSNPGVAIEEMKRVCKKTVVLKVPNATYFKTFTEDPDHMFSWNMTTFQNFLKKHFTHVKVYGNKHRLQSSHNKLRRFKLLVLSLIVGTDELIAVCEVDKKL